MHGVAKVAQESVLFSMVFFLAHEPHWNEASPLRGYWIASHGYQKHGARSMCVCYCTVFPDGGLGKGENGYRGRLGCL
jgi:hypothetical protein